MANDQAKMKQIIPRLSLLSPAIRYRLKEYPSAWQDKVPLMVRMKVTVMATSFDPISRASLPALNMANEGETYYCVVSSYGLVAVLIRENYQMPVAPGNYEVVEFHVQHHYVPHMVHALENEGMQSTNTHPHRESEAKDVG